MTLWITLPSSVIPEPSLAPDGQEADPWYQRICCAFEQDSSPPQDTLCVPRARATDAEDLAARAVKQVLSIEGNDRLKVNLLVVCRSSAAIGGSAPTYRLSAKAGLRNALPFSLAGQAGAEVAQALTFVRHMSWEANGVVVISAVQRVVPPDARVRTNGFPFADAAAAIVVARSRGALAKAFRVLSVVSGQSVASRGDSAETVLSRAVEVAGVARPSIKWAIAHRCSAEFESAVRRTLPDALWLSRDLYPSNDFGCADSLIALQRVFTSASEPPCGLGALWFAGRFGAVAVVLLDSTSVALWKRQVSLDPQTQGDSER